MSDRQPVFWQLTIDANDPARLARFWARALGYQPAPPAEPATTWHAHYRARLGGEAATLAVHVKGLELPGYEPRTLHAMALGLAVNARGADHNRSGAYEADLSGSLDRLAGGRAHVAAAVATEDRAAVMDSMILCKFLRGVFEQGNPYEEWAALLRSVTGWDTDGAELQRTARRIVLAKRVFNLREGWTPADDWLPRRLLDEPLEVGSGRVATLTAERLRSMVDGYWAVRGLDAQGRPDQAALQDLLLDSEGTEQKELSP
jgi:aldehyde:ferredoxin oxidoreductase